MTAASKKQSTAGSLFEVRPATTGAAGAALGERVGLRAGDGATVNCLGSDLIFEPFLSFVAMGSGRRNRASSTSKKRSEKKRIDDDLPSKRSQFLPEETANLAERNT
ncbi:MAG: hypothetical protein ABSF93_13120 [Candidatus Sulfotelmatobacter sp.]